MSEAGTAGRLDAVTDRLYTNGLGFFVPYVLVYLAGWALRVEPTLVRTIFLVLHVTLATLLLVHCVRRRRLVDPVSALFWIGLTVAFLLPGPYLEYPDDPWEQIRRIFSWEQASSIGERQARLRFASFWMWSWIAEVPIPGRRLALAAFSCFWQMLLAVQVYRFSRSLGYDRVWARVQVVGTVCLLGTNLFSFFRYHALASTPLAYCAYLAATALLVRGLGLSGASEAPERTPNTIGLVLWIILLAVVMGLNHRQELLFFVISGCTLALLRASKEPRLRRPIAALLGFAAVGAVAFAVWNMGHQELVRLAQWFPWAKGADSWLDVSIWRRLVGAWGRGLGLHHAVAVVAAIALVRRTAVIAWLTIVPVATMYFPPIILIATALHGSSGEWFNERFPLAMSGSFILAEAVWLSVGTRHRRGAVALAVAVLVILGLPPAKPFRGRLWFQFHASPPSLELEPVDAAAEWVHRHRVDPLQPSRKSVIWSTDWATAEGSLKRVDHLLPPDRCLLVADGATAFALSAQLGLRPGTVRRRSQWPARVPTSPEALEQWASSAQVCAFLVADPGPEVTIPTSRVAALAGRADADVVRDELTTPAVYRDAIDSLASAGWRATPVPPFYTLYEPQGIFFGSASARQIWAGQPPGPRELFADGFERRGMSAWTVFNE